MHVTICWEDEVNKQHSDPNEHLFLRNNIFLFLILLIFFPRLYLLGPRFLSVYFNLQYLSENLNKLLSNDKDSVGFNEFYKKYKEYYPNNKIPNKEFLEWFIGFT